MDQELARLRPANLAQTRVIPTEIIFRRTKREVLQELERGQKRGEFGACSDLKRVPGQGWAVKVHRLKDEPAPMPLWAKTCIRVGLVLIGLVLALAILAAALGALLGSVFALPWAEICAVAILAVFLTGISPAGRKCCQVVVNVWH